MKWTARVAWVLCSLLVVGCAQGELSNPGAGDAGEESREDVDRPDGGDDNSVDGSPDTDPPPSDAGDAAVDAYIPDEDGGEPDAGPPENCDEVTCEEGVCEPDTLECVECIEHDDCSDGLCHIEHPVCIRDCCDETTEDGFVDLGYIHDRYDIAVTGDGEPRMVVGNDDDEVLQYAQPVDGTWLKEDFAEEAANTSTKIKLALDADDDPHVLYSEYERLVYYWRGDSGWESQELVSDDDGDDPSYADLVFDDDGTLHIMSLLNYGDDILYVTREENGAQDEETFAFPEEDGAAWLNLDVTSDNRPIASFYVGPETELIVGERSSSGDWDYESVTTESFQIHGMAVGPDDEPTIAYHRSENDGLRLLSRDGSDWTDEVVFDEPEVAYSPDIAIDDLGDPHVVYTSQNDDGADLGYLRFDGEDYQTHLVESFESATYPRVVLDDQRIAHAVSRDSSRDAVTYVRFD